MELIRLFILREIILYIVTRWTDIMTKRTSIVIRWTGVVAKWTGIVSMGLV